MWFSKKRKEPKKIDGNISVEKGYALCGTVRGPKGFKMIDCHLTEEELKKHLSWVAKELGITPTQVWSQLNVSEAFRINGLLQEAGKRGNYSQVPGQ